VIQTSQVVPLHDRIPTRACVSAKNARSEAIRKSQPSANWSPPVTSASSVTIAR
jgi:hypothetical protein